MLDRHPNLTPLQLIEVLRATSQVKEASASPVINLDAALARLSTGD
jgi:hypothetical protein